jgi:glycosyltransferase involved in cell wall biosynthesis
MSALNSATRPMTIVSYPDYRAGNSYQKLLYSSYEGSVLYGDIQEAIKILKLGLPTIFHVNWINQVIVVDAEETARNISRFKEDVDVLKSCGGLIAWTVHNLFGHSTPEALRETERKFRKWLLENVDILILHKPSHLKIVVSEYGAIPKRVFVHNHGLYDVEASSKSEATEFDSLAADAKSIIGLIGQVRPYKGLNEAVQILRALSPEMARDAHVLIAGKIEWSFKDEIANIVSSLREKIRVTLIDRRLDDAELLSATKICKAILLPYRNILNSGSLRYNQTVGTMSLMPARHAMLFADEPGVLFYDDYAHAAQLLDGIIQQSHEEVSAMKQSIVFQAREQLCWPDLTNVFAGLG